MANRAYKPVPRKTRLARFLCWLVYGHDRSERRYEVGPMVNNYLPNYKPNKYQYVVCSKCGEIIGRKLINGKA